jgi:hypothetical protein
MEAENSPTTSRFPTVRRCARAIFSRGMAYGIIILVTLVALLYAEENFRGKRAWENYRRDAEARGVKFDFLAHVPPPIPDAENGANTPFIQSWFPKPKPDDTNQWPTRFSEANSLVTIKRRTKGPGAQDDRAMTDLTAWQEAFAMLNEPKNKRGKAIERESHGRTLDPQEQAKAALAILEELKIYAPVLDELRAASQRPRIRYPVEYKVDDPFSILLPHLAKTKALVQELRIQASAELAAGLTNRAFEDVRLMLWLADSLKDEGFLISQLVRIAEQQIAAQPLWEGLVQHKWSEAQLKEMQERFSRVNFADSMNQSMEAERAGGIAVVQNTIKRNNLAQTLANITASEAESAVLRNTSKKALDWTIPRGWLYSEMANYSSFMDGMITNGWDADAKVFHPRSLDQNEKSFEAQMRGGFSAIWHHQVLAHLLLPALTKASMKFSRAQSTANQAALACALERYYLGHGSYPDSLSKLVPEYLARIPNQAVSDQPMKYLPTGEGYILYSVGWDGVDNGGAFLKPINGNPEIVHPQDGDWVWRSSP